VSEPEKFPTLRIREFLHQKGGRALIGEVYEAVAGRAIRETSAILERLAEKGDLRFEGPEVVYLFPAEPRGRKGQAAARLWRGAHQLSKRGPWGTADLSQVSMVSPRETRRWLTEMKRRALILPTGQFRYLVSKDAPHRDNPPAFKWHKPVDSKPQREARS